MVVEAPHPIEVRADGPDIFWNVIFRPELQGRRYIRAVEIKPGNPKIAHHANLLVDRTGGVARREAKPGYGFPGNGSDDRPQSSRSGKPFPVLEAGLTAVFRTARAFLDSGSRERARSESASAALG